MGRPKTLENAENINIRVNGVFKAKVKKAAEAVGQSLSDWVIETLRYRIEEGDKPSTNSAPGSQPELIHNQIPPVLAGVIEKSRLAEAPFGKSVTEFLESRPVAAEVPMLEPEPPRRSWSEVYARAKKEGDFGDEYFGDQIQAAGVTRFPQGFRTWPVPKQVAWLDENYPLKPE